MALILADRVKETSTTAGNGVFTLAGAATGFQSFAVVGNGNTTYYCIAGQGTNEWEVGIGTYASAGTTLTRTTVLSNSSATEPTALVFAAGTKDVFVTYPSEKSVNLDASGNATALGTPVAFTGTNITGTATSFTASNVTTNANLTNEATSVGNAVTLTNSAVIGKVLTGYVSGAGTVAATDSILQAIQKLNGNTAASGFPATTAMVFKQTAAPTGWTKVLTNDNSALRVVTGAASTGGSVAFTTAFASQTPAGTVSVSVSAGTLAVGIGTLASSAVTLSTTQIPAHNHNQLYQLDRNINSTKDVRRSNTSENLVDSTSIQNTGGGGSHTHTLSGTPALSGSPSITSSTFTGTAINLAVSYIDVIVATKD